MHIVSPTRIEQSEPSARRRRLAVELGWSLGAAGLSLAIAIWSLQLWRWRPGIPLGLEGDSTFVAMQLKDIAEHGWYWHNPDLGFPFGQNGSLFPELNVIHVEAVKFLGLAFDDPFSPGVMYFVAGFPLAALAMYLLARSQRIARSAAMLVGVLFACAPGHQERFGHLWLAAYWVLPLGVWVVLEIMGGEPLLTRSRGARRRYRFSLRSACAIIALTIVGLSGVYYVAFVLILLAVATVGRRWSGGRPRDWFPGLGAALYLSLVILVPLLLARWGAAGEVVTGRLPATRSIGESELFAGKMMDLVLPWIGHRVDALASLTTAYNTLDHATVENSALGLIALAGSIGLVGVVLRTLVTGKPGAAHPRHWATLSGVCFMFFIVGGMGAFTAIFFTVQVRTWSRISLVIMLFGLLAVGYWLTSMKARSWGSKAVVGASIGLLIIGVLDQTNPVKAPRYDDISQRLSDVSPYVVALEGRLEAGCGVFQLPVVPFPESFGAGRMNGYDQLIPYLLSNNLRWSVGAMRGTAAADWQKAMDLRDVANAADELAAAGFCAIEVDTQGFDRETDPRRKLALELGPPIAQSRDGVYVAYALPSKPERWQRAKKSLLEPVLVGLEAYEIRLEDGHAKQWVSQQPKFSVANLSSRTVTLDLSMMVRPEGAEDRDLTISDSAGHSITRVHLRRDETTAVTIEFDAPPGLSSLEMKVSGSTVRMMNPDRTVTAEIMDIHGASKPPTRVATEQEQMLDGILSP